MSYSSTALGRPSPVPVSTWNLTEPWWIDLPDDLVGTRLEDLPTDPLAGFERELTDADAPIEQRPGGSLAMHLDSLDLDTLSDGDLVDAAGAVAREASWLAALEIEINDRLASRAKSWRGIGPGVPPGPECGIPIEPERVAASELAATQNISEGFARMKVELAVALRRLPLTRIALAAGRIDLAKARAIVEAVAVLDVDAAAELEARVLERAPGQTLAGLRRSLRRAVTAADPAAAEARRMKSVLDRRVVRGPSEDGMGCLVWTGPVEQTEAFWVWLTAAADAAKFPGDSRTLAQRRSDVLADIAANGLAASMTHTGADLPLRHGRRPHVSVVVAASTLLGLDDEPGELEGAGPITAELARLIAADGTWQRLLTDPASGRLLELSEDTYEPSQELRDHVIARDRYCRWPGCRMPANRCDLDHAIPYPAGPTDAKNMHPLHWPHHVVKTHTDMTVAIESDGTMVWTFPSGRIYRLSPTRVLEHPRLDPQTLRDALRALTDDLESDECDEVSAAGPDQRPVLNLAGPPGHGPASPDEPSDRAGPRQAASPTVPPDDVPPF